MNRAGYKTLASMMWLAPLVMALRYWMLWDRLPLRMATHFNAAGEGNGWMPRDVSLYVDLGFLAFLLAVFSFVLYLVSRRHELGKLAWALLAFFHVEVWTTLYLLNSTLQYNIDGTPIVVAPLLVVTPLGALAIVVLAVVEKRGASFAHSPSDVVAEEVHSGKTLSLLFLLPLVAVIVTVVTVPNSIARLSVAIFGALVLAAFVMAWDGFHYFFTRHGVEIRALGFRLKSIPLMQIKDYAIASWSPMRGYGIRGVGNCRAYVWGRTGVRVEMYDGEVFLGHEDPQRIVHDLNAIKSYQHL
jgi:Protein of unknown function (DUF1648)